MGNAVGTPSRLAASEAVSDLQGVTYKDSLGERRRQAAGGTQTSPPPGPQLTP